jgi:nucleotide-binding universal stress UspA family protein
VPLVVTHVWAGLPGDALGAVDPFSYDLRQAYAAADRMIAESVAGWAEKFPDVEVDRMPLHDPNAARTLLDASAMAGLVVVGARRRDRHSGQSLGPVPRTLLAEAACPVVVVRLTRSAYA